MGEYNSASTRRSNTFVIAVTQFAIALIMGVIVSTYMAVIGGDLEGLQAEKATDLFNIVIGAVFGYPFGVGFGALLLANIFHMKGSSLSLILGLVIAALVVAVLAYLTDVQAYPVYYGLLILIIFPFCAVVGYNLKLFK